MRYYHLIGGRSVELDSLGEGQLLGDIGCAGLEGRSRHGGAGHIWYDGCISRSKSGHIIMQMMGNVLFTQLRL